MLKQIIGYCIPVCILPLAEIYRELHTFRVTRYRISCRKWKADAARANVIFISDLHNHIYGTNNDPLVDAVRKEKPDLILIGGDTLVNASQKAVYEPAAAFIERLCPIAPVYCTNGNHEQQIRENTDKHGDTYQRYKSRLERSGAIFLENESATVTLKNGEELRLTGLELPMKTYDKTKRVIVRKSDITRRIGAADKTKEEVLLSHNPLYTKECLEWGADIILSGHLHGGLICLPGGRTVISPQFRLFPKYASEMRKEDGRYVVVSRGLGTHTINLRLFNPAELIVLELEGAKKQSWESL